MQSKIFQQFVSNPWIDKVWLIIWGDANKLVKNNGFSLNINKKMTTFVLILKYLDFH